MSSNLKRLALVAVIAAVCLQPVIGGVAAQPATNDDLNHSADNAPNWYIYEDQVEIGAYDMAEFDDPRAYYDDNGDKAFLPASLNDSIDNRVGFVATQVESDTLATFPRKGDSEDLDDTDEFDNLASALDASEYTTGGAASGKLSVTQTDGQTAQGVQSITVATDDSMTAGDVAYASYTNVSITTDAAKRVMTEFVDVNSLDTETEVSVQVRDSDGDYVEALINSSLDPTDDDVIANGTGVGYVHQHKLADLTVQGNGDGSIDEIEELRIEVTDGDADVTFSALDVGRKSAIDLGTYQVDTDDDDELESETVQEITSPGEHRYSDIASIGDVFQESTIHQLSVYGIEYDAEHADETSLNFSESAAEPYKDFPSAVNYKTKITVPTAIDLTHHSLELRADQAFVQDRYLDFEYVEGTSDTQLEDIDAWTSVMDSLEGQGDTLQDLDTTIQPGTTYATHTQALVYDDEKSTLVAGGAGHRGQEPDGILGMLWGPIGGALAAIGGVLGISRYYGG